MAGNYDYIEANLLELKRKIEKISLSCGREPSEIHIIAVSKTFPPEAINVALKCNHTDFGENRVQELISKSKEFNGRTVHWHLVGKLQTNKVKLIVPVVFLIHSLDSLKLALKINTEGAKINKVIKCLLQVNTSGEQQKSGCEPSQSLKLVREIAQLEYVKLQGLMTIGKMMSDEKDVKERKVVRENFRVLKELYSEIKDLNIPNTDFKYLSMGMTSDYDIAIEEGSNMLRIGSAIFGIRNN
ncbi:MAG: YggS family pyridoxal phosphate-dependent enzyme [Ignavibacteria bacterium]|nr:YggS family pyridoxal phosphate-dependent enzyme [Ignavibacteria bacterium]